MRRSVSHLLILVGTTVTLAWPALAEAREPKRKGLQAELLVGGTDCIDAKGDCESDNDTGGTKGSGGLSVDVGWRAHKVFLLGASYTVAGFTPTWKFADERVFNQAYQQGVFAVVRGYIPIWRIDIGLELSPGWSRQTFVLRGDEARSYSQGFALRPGMSVDYRLLERLFIGARVDFILAFHGQFCTREDSTKVCSSDMNIRQAPVHQVLAGVHFGVDF